MKKALLRSHDSTDELSSIEAATSGIVFIGTPHAGSKTANVAAFFTKLISYFRPTINKAVINSLRNKQPDLYQLDRSFFRLCAKRTQEGKPIELRCFVEARPVSDAIGQVSAKVALVGTIKLTSREDCDRRVGSSSQLRTSHCDRS